ncbi:Gfo/Idh/MocA family protein [Pseudooceanicola marinus]|uniref:Gfo/Idh/MocA family protein n=1 Tax=Pseudooceanicola marinus TaxID=396013 RepID=UPI001CD3F2DD|nr:Gfo/Idh/MocA family oxidoreductase [Pseudooceanicola marinus]MCA1337472.1 Gfo/Idh/MocA family oxidoreductase [Pseudooceanicola marinus]
MTQSCKWGIMATGLIAERFVKDLTLAGLPVTAVGSRSGAKAQTFAQEHGIPSAHGSYEALVADPNVDIIYVATPHPFHLEGARLALEAGKHVMIEKPFAMNAAEAAEITALARARGLFVLEAMWTRFLPHMTRLHEILAAGTIGQVHTLKADHSQDLPDAPEHRLNKMELGGGALLDLGIYPVSFACDILGLPAEAQAVARFRETGADAGVAIILRHENGAISELSCASDFQGPNTATIIGDKGRIELDAIWYAPTRMCVYDSKGELVEEFAAPNEGRGMQHQAIAAAAAISAGETGEPRMQPSETVEILGTMDSIRDRIGLRYAADRD